MIRIATLLFVLGCAVSAEATTYYVRTDGNNANAGTSNTVGGAWQTIAKCATTTLVAGDVCRVQAGTYVVVVSPTRNGSSGAGNTITLVADGTVKICGMTFTGQNYIRTVGFTMDASIGACANGTLVAVSGTNTGLEFWNDALGPAGGASASGYIIDVGSNGALCNACIWFGGSINNIGQAPSGATGLATSGNDNFIAYIDFNTICWNGIEPIGSRLRVYNLYLHGWNACGGQHTDFFYVPGASSLALTASLWESLFGIGTNDLNNKSFHSENDTSPAWNDNMMRLNVFVNNGSASFASIYCGATGTCGDQLRWRLYNNDHILGDRAVSGSDFSNCGNVQSLSSTITYWVYNTISYECWADVGVTANAAPWATTSPASADYNLIYTPLTPPSYAASWTGQVHARTNVNPGFTNVASNDFTLTAGGGARSVGGPLTAAVGSGSGSTALTVTTNTGSFFVGSNASNLPQYSGLLVPGDTLTVGSCTAAVSSVSGDTLTLATACTWANGDPVYFGSSTTIDIGAYPYKAGGYALSATYQIAGVTATIMPNDSSLVRYVVCYDSTVPTTVVNASPYTCSTGSGTFSARVYPRYASTTLGTDATLAGGVGRFRFMRGLSPGLFLLLPFGLAAVRLRRQGEL